MAAATSPRSARPASPFTLPHFERYIAQTTLDSGELGALEDFQREVVADIFAGFRECWVIIPEGNGKTTLMAWIALYHADFTSSPWVPIGAASRDQAEILFSQAAGFVERSALLMKRFRVYEGYRKIVSRTNGGRGIRVYAADQRTGDGVIPTLCLVDELHRHKDLGLYTTWRGKLNKRGGQIVTISTAGEPGTAFEDTRDRIRDQARDRVRRGRCYIRAEGPGIVLHEFKVPDVKQARDLEVVKEANPLSTITTAVLREKLESPTTDFGENWLRLTCNIPARSSEAAITDAEWDSWFAGDGVEIPPGERVELGIDVAWKHDTTAFAPLWMPRVGMRLLGAPTVLVPPRDGTMLDPQFFRDAFDEINGRNPVQLVVMDRERAEEFASWLENDRGVKVVFRGKTAQPASEDYEAFMGAGREGWLKHTGDATLRRHALNAVARKLPNDRTRFDRPSSSRSHARQDVRVVDALDAAAMVHYVAAANFKSRPRGGYFL